MKHFWDSIQIHIQKYSSGKNIIVLFILTQIIYFLMLLYTIPNLTSFSNGLEILDLKPLGYSSNYVKELFESLDSDGRDYYLYRQIPLDMIYPLLFAITFTLLISFLFRKGFKANSKIHLFSMIPIVAGLFDYCENIGIIIMLVIYPSFSVLLAEATNIFSILKSVGTTAFFILLFIGIGGIIYNKFKKSSKQI